MAMRKLAARARAGVGSGPVGVGARDVEASMFARVAKSPGGERVAVCISTGACPVVGGGAIRVSTRGYFATRSQEQILVYAIIVVWNVP